MGAKRPISKSIAKKFVNKKYSMACTEPYLWMEMAKQTLRAADILFHQFVDDL